MEYNRTEIPSTSIPAYPTPVEKTEAIRYPREVALVHRQQTVYINSNLLPADAAKGQCPLTIYDSMNSHFSRYEVCLINQQKQAATANMSVSDVLKLQRMTDYAYAKNLETKQATSGDSEKNRPGWTVKFVSGNLKGMSPAQVIAEEGEGGIQKLRDQYKYLQQYADKYPNNKKIMDAILDAIEINKAGKIQEGGNTGPARLVLHATGMRPLTRKVRNDGKSFVYDMTITWTFGADNPVNITTENYYAPVVRKDDGRLNVMYKERDTATAIKNSMDLSADEWADMMYLIQADMRRFEMLHAKTQYEAAERAQRMLRQNNN